MKIKILNTLLFLLIFSLNNLYAQQLKDTTVLNFKPVDSIINSKINAYGAKEVLVVLDIDNTILTSDTDLGSDTWYRWQRGKLPVKPTREQKLPDSCLFNEAIPLLYDLGTMSLTDSLLPAYIKVWQADSITIIALTSRSPQCRAATERELLRNNIDLSQSQLKTIEGNKMMLRYDLNNRAVNYSDGIFMTSGLNKGDMLAHIIGRTGKSFKAIVYVDDGKENIDNVENKYATCNDMDVVLIYYPKIVTERLKKNHNQELTKEQADTLSDDWNTLLKTLNSIFPERVGKAMCGCEKN